MLRVIGLDIAAPLVVFQLGRALGFPVVWALVLSGLPPLVGVGVDWIRMRTVEVVGAVVLGGIALSVVLALVSDNPRVVLLEDVAFTVAFGLVCVASTTSRRPLIFFFAQAFYGGPQAAAGREMDVEYATYPEARSFWRSLAVVWGVTYLLESGIRVAVILRATPETALTVNRVMPWVVYAVLMAGSFVWGHRVRATKPS